MSIVKRIKRIAKKIARRFRTKGTSQAYRYMSNSTVAQRLILNNWNITFSNPPAARAGTNRRIIREAKT